MTVFQATILGLLQGLTEFLPISSSAHLALLPWFLGWPVPGLPVDVALHLGTLVAVLHFFRREWVRLAAAAWRIVVTRRVVNEMQWRVIYLVLATIPGALGGLLLERYAERAFRAPWLTGVVLIAFGVVLWLVDREVPEQRPLAEMRWTDALLVGVAQILALVPGVSRSGATITTGRALRFDRESAAVFSFLMSAPIIGAASVLELPEALRAGVGAPLVAGVLAAAVSGWVAIAVLLRYVSRHSYGIFAAYRALLGAAVLLLLIGRG